MVQRPRNAGQLAGGLSQPCFQPACQGADSQVALPRYACMHTPACTRTHTHARAHTHTRKRSCAHYAAAHPPHGRQPTSGTDNSLFHISRRKLPLDFSLPFSLCLSPSPPLTRNLSLSLSLSPSLSLSCGLIGWNSGQRSCDGQIPSTQMSATPQDSSLQKSPKATTGLAEPSPASVRERGIRGGRGIERNREWRERERETRTRAHVPRLPAKSPPTRHSPVFRVSGVGVTVCLHAGLGGFSAVRYVERH